jgi:hypothetical protein
MTAQMRYIRCARVFDSLSRIELELQTAWEEAYADMLLPERDDELADLCKETLERVRALKLKCQVAMRSNRKAALR